MWTKTITGEHLFIIDHINIFDEKLSKNVTKNAKEHLEKTKELVNKYNLKIDNGRRD